ncbi:DUF2378 family protein [Myxococcus virescens]|uniref:Myxococcales-restricted protein, TIGR02265 family n=2 Tax=Myxococcus TaxID=32 RepID=A0A511HRH2_9BACT|nr:DUF2378 family protein [Myxococcus virescens]GEL75099.1 hypothetical protein MVI01_68830 [Myxococcus virescens]SDE70848.1 Myxococcales-restricted protein, TIGR02265 family [Myxococcus virescens]
MPPSPPRVPASVFEGFFVRGLQAEGRLAQELEALGYDSRKPELDYPISLWQQAVALARRERYAELGDEDAYRQLGRQGIFGFAQTLVGRVAAVALPMIGPAQALERVPRYLAMMGRSDVDVSMSSEGERGRRLSLSDRYNRPELMAGCLEGMLELANARPRISVEERSSGGYRLFVRW